VDTNTLHVDATNNRVGIGTSSPSHLIDGRLSGTSSGEVISVGNVTNGSFGGIAISDGGTYPVRHWGSSLEFYTGNSTYSSASKAMTIDSSGNVGVGTSSPSTKIHAYDASTDAVLYVDSGNANGSHMRFLASGAVKHFVGSGGGFGLGDVDDFGIRSFDNILFSTGNSSTEAMRIESNSIKVATDEFIPTGSGKDLGSPTYQWRDLYLSGGVYLGGTGSANHLDDYEEGTWTVGVSFDTSGSATVYSAAAASGRYTKIGNTVHVTGFFQTSSISSPVGILRLTGLPFTVSGAADTAGSLGYSRRWGSDLPNLKISAGVGGTTCYFNKNATNATAATFLEGSDLSASGNYNSLYFQLTYQAT
jgi:hypothetical protein